MHRLQKVNENSWNWKYLTENNDLLVEIEFENQTKKRKKSTPLNIIGIHTIFFDQNEKIKQFQCYLQDCLTTIN